MSEAAKSARAAMKEKAKRMAKGDPRAKVDASSWTPPEPLDADVKTGLRPVSRRAFKKGGKVVGEMAEHHAGRMPRAFANAKVNRDVKDANEEREGKKHVGGMKKGGKAEGGATKYKTFPEQWLNESYTGRAVNKIAEALGAKKAKPKDYDMGVQRPSDVEENVPLPPRRPAELNRGAPQPSDTMDSESVRRMNEESARPGYSRKSGGRTKKMDGGLMDPRAAAAKRMADASAVAGVPTSVMNFGGIKKGALSPLRGMKKGGTAKHDDEAQDKALIKKMVKPSAQRAKGGECALDGEMQGTRPTGGRKARKSGGRAKGKTNINIVIAQKPDQTPMPGPAMPPLGAPVPVPVPPMAAGPGAPPPMPMPMPPMGPPPGGPPMMRRDGGRTYPKMHYGAGGGLGRLEKIDEYGLSQR